MAEGSRIFSCDPQIVPLIIIAMHSSQPLAQVAEQHLQRDRCANLEADFHIRNHIQR